MTHHCSRFASLPGRLVWICALSAGWLAAAGPVRADDLFPQAVPASKYAKMAGHSPFAPPTVPVAVQATPPPAPPPGWADNLTATMIAQEGANYIVTVVDAQNSQQHLYLTSEPDHDTQMAVVSVKWGANRDDPPIITLRKGSEFAQVRYETVAGSGAPSPVGGQPIPGAPRNLQVPPVNNQAFHAPPYQANAALPANQGPANNVIRRPLIRAQPPTAPTAGRPGPNMPNAAGVRPNPAVQVDNDDDD